MKRLKSPLIKNIDLVNNNKGDKVKVIRFMVNPKKPGAGEPIKIKFKVLNVSGKTLKLIPWRIVKNKTIIYSGYRFNLPANSSFEVAASWIAVKGNHFFYADIDPQNVLNEPRSKQFGNFPQGEDIVVNK